METENQTIPFCEAFRYVAATGERPESFLSITQLDEYLMITGNILNRPHYAADRRMAAWARELQAAIHRLTASTN